MRDLQNLMPFVQAVKCGSFAAAAARLQVTPPAISKSIARLERELDVRLFNRDTRHLELTSEGRELFEQVGGLIAGIDEAVAKLAGSAREPRGVVRVSVTATFGRHCLLPVISEFFVRYPHVELDISFDETPLGFTESGIDVRIRHGKDRDISHVSRELCDYPLVLVASPDYIGRRGSPRCPEDLADHDCIAVRRTFGRAAWHLYRYRPLAQRTTGQDEGEVIHNPRGPITVATQLDASLIACFYGAGIAACSVPVILPHLKSGRLKVVLPDYRIRETKGMRNPVVIQYPHRKHQAEKVRVFVDFVVEQFRNKDYISLDISQYAA